MSRIVALDTETTGISHRLQYGTRALQCVSGCRITLGEPQHRLVGNTMRPIWASL